MRRVDFAWRRGELGEAGDEAGFVAQRGGGVVVGVAALPVGEDDDAGAEAAEDGGDLEAVGEGVLDVAVGEVESFAVGDIEDAGGGVGFGFALGGGAASAGLASREVEDAGAPAARVHDEERATAGLFYIVAVGGDGEDVDGRDGGHMWMKSRAQSLGVSIHPRLVRYIECR